MPTLSEKKREVERIGVELGVAGVLADDWSTKLIAAFDDNEEAPLARAFVDYVQNDDVRCALDSINCFLRRVAALDGSELMSRDIADFVPFGALRDQPELITNAFTSLRNTLESKLLRLASASLVMAQKTTPDNDADTELTRRLLQAIQTIVIGVAPLFDPTLKAVSDGQVYAKRLLAVESAITTAYAGVGDVGETLEPKKFAEMLRSTASPTGSHTMQTGPRASRSASPGRVDKVKIPMDAIDNIVKKAVDGAGEKFTRALDARPQVSALDVFFPTGVLVFITTTYSAVASAIAFLEDLVNRSGQMVLMGLRANALSGMLDYPPGITPSWYTETLLGYVEVAASGTRTVHLPTIIQTYLQWNDFIFSFPRVYLGPYGLYTSIFIILIFFAVRHNSAAKNAARRVFTTENIGRAVEIGGRVVRIVGKGLAYAGEYFENRGTVIQTHGADEEERMPRREQLRRIAHPISASRSHSPHSPRL